MLNTGRDEWLGSHEGTVPEPEVESAADIDGMKILTPILSEE